MAGLVKTGAGSEATVTIKVADPVPSVLVAPRLIDTVLGVTGVPVITPVEGLILQPVGNPDAL